MRAAGRAALAAAIAFLSPYHLAALPRACFDECSHLIESFAGRMGTVAETLVRHGVYADRSRDGFRYCGPTHSSRGRLFVTLPRAAPLVGRHRL